MSGLDDFIKGATLFKQGMQELAVNNALQDATKKIQDVNALMADENDRLAASTQVANELAMRMAASGADAAKIEATAGRMGVGAGAQFNAQYQREAQASTQKFNASESALDRKNAYDIALLGLAKSQNAAAGKLDKEQDKLVIDAGTKFESAAKKHLEAVGQARSAKALLASGNPIADNAIGTFMARATGEVGNLTEAERKPFTGSMDIRSQLSQAMQQWKSGTLTAKNRKLVELLAGKMEESAKSRVLETRKRFGMRTQKLLQLKDTDMPLEEVEKIIFDESAWDEDTGAPSQQAAPTQQQQTSAPTQQQSKQSRYMSYWGK